ncbi:MAG: hypothetical protein K0S38_21 [Candidatus Paceibacter sp.]|jgi:hypothetical protein|nr:hypothetical protein [Candidatus Paceibacter sp.]
MTKARLIFGIIAVIIIGVIAWLYVSSRQYTAPDSSIDQQSTQKVSDEAIKDYLMQSNFTQPNFGGKTFIAFERLGDEKTNAREIVYIWLVAQEYFSKDGNIEKGSGISLPVALYFENGEPITLNVPRDGSNYTIDIQKIFPSNVKDQPIFTNIAAQNEIVGKLTHSVALQAQSELGLQLDTPPVATDQDEEIATTTPEVATTTSQ